MGSLSSFVQGKHVHFKSNVYALVKIELQEFCTVLPSFSKKKPHLYLG